MFTTFWVNLTQKTFHLILTPKKAILGHFLGKKLPISAIEPGRRQKRQKVQKFDFWPFSTSSKNRSNGQKMPRNTSFES